MQKLCYVDSVYPFLLVVCVRPGLLLPAWAVPRSDLAAAMGWVLSAHCAWAELSKTQRSAAACHEVTIKDRHMLVQSCQT